MVYGSFAFTLINLSLPLEVPVWASHSITCFSFIFLHCAFPLLFLKMRSLLVFSHNFPFFLQSFKNPFKPLQSNFMSFLYIFPSLEFLFGCLLFIVCVTYQTTILYYILLISKCPCSDDFSGSVCRL